MARHQQIIMPMPPFSDAQMDLLPPTAPVYRNGCWRQGLPANPAVALQRGRFLLPRLCALGQTSLETLHGNIASLAGLARNQKAMCELMHESLEKTGFGELSRLRELISDPYPP